MNSESASAATRLCAACGMCCDGSLFHAVVLQPEDSPRALAARGLKVKRRRGEAYFHHPCPAHLGDRCGIYEQRPARCRRFVCRQVLRVEAGEISEAVALMAIQAARAGINRVNSLIGAIATTNPHRALAHRVAHALTGAPAAPARELTAAMAELETRLSRDFRVESLDQP